MTRVAILGLGEAGRMFARALAGTAEVTAWDPFAAPEIDGVRLAADAAEAVSGADAVLALTTAAHSAEALASTREHAPAGALHGDFATGGPAGKRDLAERAAAGGIRFADAAIMAPVRRGAAGTPVLVSGDGAGDLAAILTAAGLPVEVLPGPPGTAAARKLLRSLLVKGLTGVMIESLRAAEREGLGDWFGEHLVDTLTGLDRAALAGFLDGTATHAGRRIEEMEAAADMAEAAGGRADIARAVARVLALVAGDPAAGEGGEAVPRLAP
ncbi:DUF1932 domain-containing protein [Agromyces archimandritae]|uniref:NAD(P)-dependent oxidoreductase n=1 Tax=Agromyces archimandritae TaxID=2781962 RepID=A0A975FL10_9MICO|nr:DUF1932 domain-containing protein [Agromyces archimandritae]QTX03821.1 NAD(P)-dependent oxidoreductase [Agromyces archimandritae]